MKNKTTMASKIIIALDIETKEEALFLVRQLKEADTFKIGLKLFIAQGPALLQAISHLGKNVFLDLKLHDIPNTVAGAVKMAARYGVSMLTIHASGGLEMMHWAAEAAKEESLKGQNPCLLAVTVLTSLGDEDLETIGMEGSAQAQVLRLAALAKEAGLDGVICSPQEISLVRQEMGSDFLIVTPGIRPSWTASHDQKRIMTPSSAIKKGADYLVIGRPITKASSPRQAFLRICQELDGAINAADSKNSS